MDRVSAVIVVIAILMLPDGPVVAQPGEVRVNLVGMDEYVVRTMRVIDKADAPIHGLVSIDAFDTTDTAFVFETPSGVMRVPASDIKELQFTQTTRSLAREQPMAQVAAWEVTAMPGKVKTITVLAQDLRITKGALIVPNASVADISDTAQHFEVDSIIFDSSKGSFRIILRAVNYEKTYYGGGGGPSGITKPIQ